MNMGYILKTERMRLVKKNDRDRVIRRKTFRRGDVLTTDDFEAYDVDPDRVDVLIEKGTLVDERDDNTEPEDTSAATAAAVVSGPVGASTSSPNEDLDHSDIAEPDTGGAQVPFDPDNPESVDEYSSMDYAELQQAAKAKGLNGGGSAEDLRARLREQA